MLHRFAAIGAKKKILFAGTSAREPIAKCTIPTTGIRRLKNDKGGNEVGWTAERMKFAPREFLHSYYNCII